MDSLDSQKAYKKYVSSMERSVHFWSEARGESRKITAARLKCAPHSDAAESLALTIWERMRPEQFRLVMEIDRLLTAHDEIRVAELRETLGQILEAVNVEIKELRAVHIAPIEALTLLLNHIIKIYNQRDVDSETSSDSFVPISTRIEQMVTKAKELGLGNIEVPKNMYVSERAKLAMVEKQIIGKMKLKSIRSGGKIHDIRGNIKFKIDGGKKRDETKKRLKKAVAIKERLKLAQNVRNNLKFKTSKRTVRKYSSFLKSDGDQTNSYHSLSSGLPPDTSFETIMTYGRDDCFNSRSSEDERGVNASIDTSSWVISSTHKYYFGCSPPVIPKTSVTHEVYPKPVEDSKMTELENAGERDLRFFHSLDAAEGAHWVAPDRKFVSKCSMDKVVLGSLKEVMSDTDGDIVREEMSTASSESRESFTMVTANDEVNCEESHGDASTIFAWTEPEKSNSFCLNSAENVMDVGIESHLMHASSDAAGDGFDLARTKEESSIHTLHDEREETEVLPPAAFSMTDVPVGIDSSCSFLSDNSPTGIQKKNLFSCNQFSEKSDNSEGGLSDMNNSSKTECPALEATSTNYGIQHNLGLDTADNASNDLTFEENSETQQFRVEDSLENAESAVPNNAEPANSDDICTSRFQAEPQFTVMETITVTMRPIKTEKIIPAQKYVQPSSSASSTANQTLTKSIIDELTVEILKRNSMTGNTEAKKETPEVDLEKDHEKPEASQSGDLSKGDNKILESSLPPTQSSYDRVEIQNEDIKSDEKTVWTSSPSQDFTEQDKEPEMFRTSHPESEFVAIADQDPYNDQPDVNSNVTQDVTPNKSVDQFSSAHDFGGTQLLYIRPSALKPKKSSKPKETSGKVCGAADETRPSSSTHSQYEAVSDITASEACKLGSDSKNRDGKRNDMVTLAVVALALGLGTLGFMTSSGAGSGGIFSEMLGPAGGKALNVIEKALQVLRALNNRH